MILSFTIPLPPHAKGRGRIIRRKNARGKVVSGIRSNSATKTWETQARSFIRGVLKSLSVTQPMVGHVTLTAKFIRQRPKSRPPNRNGRIYASREDWATGRELPATSVPDLDNYVKALLDAINGSGVWSDDGQVTKLEVEKVWCAVGEEPRVEVTILGGVE